MDLLIQKGIDVNAVSDDSSTALIKASKNGRSPVSHQMKLHFHISLISFQIGHKETVDLLIQSGARVGVEDFSNKSALAWAVERGEINNRNSNALKKLE